MRALVLLVFFTFNMHSEELKPQNIYKNSLPSVMTLHVTKIDGTASLGSAFLSIKDGIAVTAWHVVNGARTVQAKFSSGEEFEVSGVIDKDEKRDIALIRVKVFGRNLLPFVSKDPEIGSKAYVIGAPQGLEFSISDGLISQVQIIASIKLYQFTSPASPGNSGGPILNDRGEVEGVVSWQVIDGQNLNFAIPFVYVLGLDASLPTTPWANVKATEISGAVPISTDKADIVIADAITQLHDMGLYCMMASRDRVQKNQGFKNGVPYYLYSAFEDCNKTLSQLKELSFSGTDRNIFIIPLCEDLSRELRSLELLIQSIKKAETHGGWSSEANDLLAQSLGMYNTKNATSKIDTSNFKMLRESKVFASALHPIFRKEFGLEADTLGYTLGVQFLTSNSLLLVDVDENSLAFQLGFRAGDQIVRFNNAKLNNIDQFKWHLKNGQHTRAIITILRDGKRDGLEVDIPSIKMN